MAAQDGSLALSGAEPAPEEAAVAQHEGEKPDLAHHSGRVGEDGPELGAVDLRLPAGRRLEAELEHGRRRRPGLAQAVRDRGVAVVEAEITDLAQEPSGREARDLRGAVKKLGPVIFHLAWARLARSAGWLFQAECEMPAHVRGASRQTRRDRKWSLAPGRLSSHAPGRMTQEDYINTLRIDLWTKTVLTIIAAALCALAAQNAVTPATAAFLECGSSFFDPCHVSVSLDAADVSIEDWPLEAANVNVKRWPFGPLSIK